MTDHAITLTEAHLELVRREMMKSAATDLRCCADQIEELGYVWPWPDGCRGSACANSARLAREALDVLDALGWPEDEPAGLRVAS